MRVRNPPRPLPSLAGFRMSSSSAAPAPTSRSVGDRHSLHVVRARAAKSQETLFASLLEFGNATSRPLLFSLARICRLDRNSLSVPKAALTRENPSQKRSHPPKRHRGREAATNKPLTKFVSAPSFERIRSHQFAANVCKLRTAEDSHKTSLATKSPLRRFPRGPCRAFAESTYRSPIRDESHSKAGAAIKIEL